jgi:2-isopropylmalate synthase
VQKHADAEGEEVSSRRVWELFASEFLAVPEGWQLAGYDLHAKAHETRAKFRIVHEDVKQALDGAGQGLIEALVDAVGRHFAVAIAVKDFDEHAMTPGTEAKALASIMLEVDGETVAACCIDEDSSRAGLQAILSAVGRSAAVRRRLREAV